MAAGPGRAFLELQISVAARGALPAWLSATLLAAGFRTENTPAFNASFTLTQLPESCFVYFSVRIVLNTFVLGANTWIPLWMFNLLWTLSVISSVSFLIPDSAVCACAT